MAHLTNSHLESLRRYDTPTLANALDTFDVRLRNEGYSGAEIRCLIPRPEPMLGYAVTVRMKSSNPPTLAHIYADRSDWWEFIENLPTPRIIVVEDVDEEQRAAALFGYTHVSIWRALGCIGAVTNGAVRDLPAIGSTGFHLYGSGLIPSHGYAHIVEVGEPVTVNGLEVRHGDLLHGDLNGVITIPLEVAVQLPAAADALLERDRKVTDLCASKEFSVEKLREILKAHF